MELAGKFTDLAMKQNAWTLPSLRLPRLEGADVQASSSASGWPER